MGGALFSDFSSEDHVFDGRRCDCDAHDLVFLFVCVVVECPAPISCVSVVHESEVE